MMLLLNRPWLQEKRVREEGLALETRRAAIAAEAGGFCLLRTSARPTLNLLLLLLRASMSALALTVPG